MKGITSDFSRPVLSAEPCRSLAQAGGRAFESAPPHTVPRSPHAEAGAVFCFHAEIPTRAGGRTPRASANGLQVRSTSPATARRPILPRAKPEPAKTVPPVHPGRGRLRPVGLEGFRQHKLCTWPRHAPERSRVYDWLQDRLLASFDRRGTGGFLNDLVGNLARPDVS